MVSTLAQTVTADERGSGRIQTPTLPPAYIWVEDSDSEAVMFERSAQLHYELVYQRRGGRGNFIGAITFHAEKGGWIITNILRNPLPTDESQVYSDPVDAAKYIYDEYQQAKRTAVKARLAEV